MTNKYNMYYDIECPYCEKQQEIDHDDGYGYDEDQAHKQTCDGCDKQFVFYTSISYDYEVMQADCLNGGEHKMETRSTNKFFGYDECSMCGLRKNHITIHKD